MSETQETITKWCLETFGKQASNHRIAERAAEELTELQEALAEGSPKAAEEVADVVIVLHHLAGCMGFDLTAEITRKMAINRARKWSLRGDGTGYHIPAPPLPSPQEQQG